MQHTLAKACATTTQPSATRSRTAHTHTPVHPSSAPLALFPPERAREREQVACASSSHRQSLSSQPLAGGAPWLLTRPGGDRAHSHKMAEARPPALLMASSGLQEDLLNTLQESVRRRADLGRSAALLSALPRSLCSPLSQPSSTKQRATGQTGNVRIRAKHGRAAGADARALGR